MAAPLALRGLPHEILSEIVDFRAQLDGDPEDWQHEDRSWSPSMLALLSTSRQVRLCAIRHIFHDVHVYCGDIKRPMDKLRHLIVPGASDLPLGSIAPQIKSLYIHAFAGVDYDIHLSSQTPADEPSELYYDSLLGAICAKSRLRSLSLKGYLKWSMKPDISCPWDAFPPDFQRTTISFFRLPTLKTFISYGISGMPSQISADTPLQKLWITNSVSRFASFTRPTADMLSIPNKHITSLVVDRSDTPNRLCFPNLRHLSVQHLPAGILNALWTIITSAWTNLISLEIDDNFSGQDDSRSYAIPESINISLLPALKVFKYRHTQKLSDALSQPIMLPPITFFSVMGNISVLKHIDINVHFETEGTKEELLSRVYRDPSWDTLDRFLTTECFPDLEKVRITVQQWLIVYVDWKNWEAFVRSRDAACAFHTEVESALQPLFSRLLQKATVTLELQSTVHPFIY